MKSEMPNQEKLLRIEKDNNDIQKYLSSGEQTIVTPEILKLVENIKGTVKEKIGNVIDIVGRLRRQEFDENDFRKRTAADILRDGYITGCTDAALVYIALARAKGIPSKYIEAIDIKWLKNGGAHSGHIYSQSYSEEDKKWIWVDPMRRRIGEEPQNRVVYKEGMDSWDIGIFDFESLKEEFDRFRDSWIKNNNTN